MSKIHDTLPKALKSQLIIKEIEDEVLIYNLKTDEAHCLNRSAALVLAHCDGRTTVAEVVQLLEAEMKTLVEEDVIWFALEQLRKSNLLEEPFIAPPRMKRISRRSLLMRLGVSAVVAVPFIMSITAPTAAQGATCRASGAVCTSDSQCCSNNCVDNGRGVFECT